MKIESDGSIEKIWATFGKEDWSEQVDIDVHSLVGREFIHHTLVFMASHGVWTLRLDAVAFVSQKSRNRLLFGRAADQ